MSTQKEFRCSCGVAHKHERIREGGHVVGWAPAILAVVSDIPHLAAEADRRWDMIRASWGPERTAGEALAAIDQVCREVLQDSGYTVGYAEEVA